MDSTGFNIPAIRELETILTDVEKILNDRSLACVSADPNELLPLRPSDLLYGGIAKPGLPGLEEVMEKTSKATANILSERWRHQQNVMEAFWKRDRRESLLQLKSNGAAGPVKRRGLQVADVVLIDDPAASRSY